MKHLENLILFHESYIIVLRESLVQRLNINIISFHAENRKVRSGGLYLSHHFPQTNILMTNGKVERG